MAFKYTIILIGKFCGFNRTPAALPKVGVAHLEGSHMK